ncbi:MAG: addiction module antidote protein, HigA family [Alphaproteobacteria bacterium PA4]|nr:MAG: addiction module antidote protein, HigA family [Alphaproteobacteria bacterium PA4]
MLKSPITTDDLLPNPHPGAGFREDLFEAGDISIEETAAATGLSVNALNGFLDGTHRVDADFDLRFGRYFGFSKGFFLRLQNAYDLEEVQRAAGAEIDRIQPRVEHAA